MLTACAAPATLPDYEEIPDYKDPALSQEGLVGIDYLKSLSNGRSTPIDKDIFIQGFVVANDLYREYYKSIVVTDETGGIEIDIDKHSLNAEIPIYSLVAISCNGLALGRTAGKTTLGALPTSEYATDRIKPADIDRYIRVFDSLAMPDPLEITVGELSAEHITRFVFIRGLEAAEQAQGLTWCDPYEEPDDEEEDYLSPLAYTERCFTDPKGDTLAVRTLNRCEYAYEYIPDGKISLAGIVDYAEGKYILRIAYHHIYPER